VVSEHRESRWRTRLADEPMCRCGMRYDEAHRLAWEPKPQTTGTPWISVAPLLTRGQQRRCGDLD